MNNYKVVKSQRLLNEGACTPVMMSLDEELEGALAEQGVSAENRASVARYLGLLREKDRGTYEHSIRVGLLGARIARHIHLDPKVFLFAGALHDIGKIRIDTNLLNKTEGFSEADMEEMRKHPEYSHELLKGIHEFSAEIAVRHHRYQEGRYPAALHELRVPFSENTKLMVEYYARLLSLVDFYDAITTRVNDLLGEKRALAPDEVKAIMLMKHPDQRGLISALYVNGILGDGAPKPPTPLQDELYESVWKDWTGERNPRETRRFVTLACALEPLSDKPGCTTRETDISRHLRLEYFVAAAINVGDAFEQLVERILREGKQPSVIYDLAFKAQLDCAKNRGGGRINQGMLEMLIPIVASQIIFDPNYKLRPGEVLERAKGVMQATSREDAMELVKMKRLAYDFSAYHDREVPEHPEAANVYDYYFLELQNSASPTSKAHNREFVMGFPTVKQMYDSIMESRLPRFNRKVENAYGEIRQGIHRGIGPGLTADCIACAIYLVLSHHPRDRVIL